MIILLDWLGISRDTLIKKQDEYLTLLQQASKGDIQSTYIVCTFCNRLDLAERVLLDGFEATKKSLHALIREEQMKQFKKKPLRRCRILVDKSRLLFGICDPTSRPTRPGKLAEGYCYVRITDVNDGRARTLINTEVFVTRNPCLHPGDIQKFKVVDIPEYCHLVDCIVFSTAGKRPGFDLLSGGDLDGDKCKSIQVTPGIILI